MPHDRPQEVAESYWSRAHKKGEQVPVGPGKWLLWVSEHCYTLIDQMQPSASGQAMVVRCPKRNAPIDANVLLKRRPQYLDPPQH